jgi:hypothetical protein
MINQHYKEKKMKIINFAVWTVIAVFVAVVAVPAQAADKPTNKKPVAEKKVKKHKKAEGTKVPESAPKAPAKKDDKKKK